MLLKIYCKNIIDMTVFLILSLHEIGMWIERWKVVFNWVTLLVTTKSQSYRNFLTFFYQKKKKKKEKKSICNNQLRPIFFGNTRTTTTLSLSRIPFFPKTKYNITNHTLKQQECHMAVTHYTLILGMSKSGSKSLGLGSPTVFSSTKLPRYKLNPHFKIIIIFSNKNICKQTK